MYTVWSPYDGKPIPAQNRQVRDSLLAGGYLAEPPTPVAPSEPAMGSTVPTEASPIVDAPPS